MDKYYEYHKEKKLAKSKEYYEAHKEEILAKQKEKNANRTEEEKAKKREYMREWYRKRRPEKVVHKKEKREKYKSMATNKDIHIQEYENGIILIEYILRKKENCMYVGQDEYLDERINFKLKKELERQIYNIYQDKYIVVIENNSVQVFVRNKEYITQYVKVLEEFVNDKIFHATDKMA